VSHIFPPCVEMVFVWVNVSSSLMRVISSGKMNLWRASQARIKRITQPIA